MQEEQALSQRSQMSYRQIVVGGVQSEVSQAIGLPMSERFENVEQEFASLTECVEHARRLQAMEPHYFRGERSDRYLTTPSMLDRVRGDVRLPDKCRDEIEKRVGRLHADVQEFLGLDPDLAMGFLQHYEMPTELLDLTSDPVVAAFFAAGGDVGSYGLLAAIPMTQLGDANVQDLRNHPKAVRPRRQSAFTFSHHHFHNLKANECIDKLGIRWYRFKLDSRDKDTFGVNHGLLDAHTDLVAGVLQLLLDDYGKTNDWTAKWLADHVVSAPFITRVVGKDETGSLVVELVSAESAGMEYDETIERFNNHRIWSNQFRDTRGYGGLSNLKWRGEAG